MSTTTERVWEEFHKPLHRFIRHRVADEHVAEDLLQDVFLKIHQSVITLKDLKRLEGWLYQITRNTIIDYYRKDRASITLEEAGIDTFSAELSDDDVVSELLPCVQAMVYHLPAQDRQALVLTEYQGLTQKELSERLGISLSGAKSRVQRARGKLKQQLLDCCHFELDRRGHILNYQSRCQSCASGSAVHPTPLHPFKTITVFAYSETQNAFTDVLKGETNANCTPEC